MTDKYYITIGRQIGSGGLEIGQKLAKKLNITCYDRQLIEIASQESGVGKEFFEKADERDSYSIFGGMFGLRTSLIDQVYTNYFLSNENLFQIQSKVIEELAQTKPNIFVGRCADYVLKEYSNCLNIFICADKTDRRKRISQLQKINEEKAEHFIDKIDKKRSSYYNYFSCKKWGAANSYHLCINSSLLGINNTVDTIYNIVKKKFGV